MGAMAVVWLVVHMGLPNMAALVLAGMAALVLVDTAALGQAHMAVVGWALVHLCIECHQGRQGCRLEVIPSLHIIHCHRLRRTKASTTPRLVHLRFLEFLPVGCTRVFLRTTKV